MDRTGNGDAGGARASLGKGCSAGCGGPRKYGDAFGLARDRASAEERDYVGSDRFDLYGVADAEIQVFAERDRNQRLTKLYWIQFESYWPSQPDKTYNYTSDRREQHWGNTVWVRSGPTPTTAPVRAGSDREHVEAILKRAGYNPPPEVMNVRMVQLLDDPQGSGHGRQELMFIYSEDLAQTGKTLDDLTTDGKPNASWAPIEKGLVERAVTAFSVERK